VACAFNGNPVAKSDDMRSGSTVLGKTREQLERELMERLEQAKKELDLAEGKARHEAVQRYQEALESFNGLVLRGEIPEDHNADGHL
jgi:hypothetical protein